VAVLKCYFDESMDPNGELIVAGFASSADLWKSFTISWRECLDENQISHFHMHQLKSSKSKLFRHLTKDQRTQLFTKLLWLIQRHALIGVSCRVNQRDYELATTSEFRTRYGSTYAFAVQMCTLIIDRFLDALAGDAHQYSVFLESGHRNAEEALNYLREEKKRKGRLSPSEIADLVGDPNVKIQGQIKTPRITIGEVATGTKGEMVPLEAADLLAHCTLKEPDPFCGSGLDVLKRTMLIREFRCTPELVCAMTSLIADDEERRARNRQAVHQLSKLAGWGGWKIMPIPGGLLIDSRNPTPVDIEKMLKTDPMLQLIPAVTKE
jgi:hypothetical protein